MKNLKKLVAVVLTLAMILSSVAISVSALDYADVDKSSSYAESVRILSDLGILKGDEEGKFNPDAEIKRSEFAAVVARALGQENAANGAKGFSKFADVAVDHWAVGYINWAAQQGIVNGRDANTFDADAPVKYQEAVKMLVAALGYEPMAKVKGGYPTGYLVIAASNGITSGVSLSSEANAPRSAVAQLTYNALDVPLMDATYITSDGNDEYAIYNGKNDYEYRSILNYYLEIAKIKATVTDTHKSNAKLYTKGSEPKVELAISSVYNDSWENVSDLINEDVDKSYNDITPFIGNTNADEYLGYTVVAYVGLNEDDDAVVYAISPDLKSNDIVEITKDLDTVKFERNAETKSNVLSYWENIDTDRDMEELDILATASVYINGTTDTEVNDYSDAALTGLLNKASKVVLMAPKNSDVYEKIFITSYKYAIVDTVNVQDEFIKSKVNSSVDLSKDTYGDTFVYTITLDGEEIALTDLQENDVLSIAWDGGNNDNNTNRYADIVVSRNSIEGTVNETKVDGGITKYGIDGVFYQLAVGAKAISISDTGTFFLTADGKIIDRQITGSRSDNYGFITQYDDDVNFGETTYSIKLFTKDGTLKVFPVNSKSLKVITYDLKGVSSYVTYGTNKTLAQSVFFETDPKSVKYLLTDKTAGTNAHVAERFITYKLVNDEITEIAFSTETTNKDGFNRYAFDTAAYSPSTNRFGNYKISDKSLLFYIPVVANAVEEDDIELKSFTSLDEDEDYKNAFIVNFDSDRNIGAAVLTADQGFGGKSSGLAIVKSISRSIDSEGNDAKKITFVQGGEEKSFIVIDDVKIDNGTFASETIGDVTDLSKGDVFLYSLNGKDEISQLYLIYNADKQEIATKLVTDGGKISTDISVAFGIVTTVGNDITLGNKRTRTVASTNEEITADKELVAGFDQRDASTIALFDENKTSSSTGFISSFKDFSSLKESSQASDSTSKKYLAVVKLDSGDVTDVVEIAVNVAKTDTTIESLTFVGLK